MLIPKREGNVSTTIGNLNTDLAGESDGNQAVADSEDSRKSPLSRQ